MILVGALLLVVGLRGVLLGLGISLLPVAFMLAGGLLGVALLGKNSIGPAVLCVAGLLLSFTVPDLLLRDRSGTTGSDASRLPRSDLTGNDAFKPFVFQKQPTPASPSAAPLPATATPQPAAPAYDA